MICIDQIRAMEAIALALPTVDPRAADLAGQLSKLLPLIANDTEEFAAMTDLVNALAFKETSHVK